MYPALTSSWGEMFSHLFPALRGLERPVFLCLSAENTTPIFQSNRPDSAIDPVSRFSCALISCPVEPDSDLSRVTAQNAFLCLHFPKIAPSSLPNRRVHSQTGLLRFFVGRPLRLPPVPTLWFHTTSPAYSSSILSALLQRLTTLGFIVVSPAPPEPKSWRMLLKKLRDSRDAFLPFEAFPPPIAVVAGRCGGTLRCAPSMRGGSHLLPGCHPALLLDLRRALKPANPVIPKDPRIRTRNAHALRKFTSRLAASSFGCHGKFPSHFTREPRGLSPSSGPLRDRRFQLSCPVLPWAWAPPAFAKRSQYVKDRFLRTRLSALTVRLSPVSWGS